MAKLIKRNANDGTVTGEQELTQIAEARRAPIIDREIYQARDAAIQIRERAQQQADEILVQAKQQVDEMMAQAQAQAEQLKAHAKQQGFTEGQQQGAAKLSELVARSSARVQQIESELVPQISTLATNIARKILGRELEFHPEAVVQIVRQALLEKARQRREIFLRVHPDDLELLRQSKPELLEILSRTKEIGIRDDPEVQRYGVIIETDAGTIDAQLDTQLAVFEKVLGNV